MTKKTVLKLVDMIDDMDLSKDVYMILIEKFVKTIGKTSNDKNITTIIHHVTQINKHITALKDIDYELKDDII